MQKLLVFFLLKKMINVFNSLNISRRLSKTKNILLDESIYMT